MEIDELEDKLEKIVDECGFINQVEEKLIDIYKAKFVDEKIDDGLDGNPDDYLMMRSYDIGDKGYIYHVKVYYGNVTETVGYVTVTEKIKQKVW